MGDNILLFSEDEDLLRSLSEQLGKWGHTPRATSNHEEALDILQRLQPPIALVDNLLTQVDSLSFLNTLRRTHPWTQAIFLVFVACLERGAMGLELGASDFLVKPVNSARLGVALRRAQERRVLRRKVAVLSGELPPEPTGLTPIQEMTYNGAICATRLYDTRQQYQELFDEVPCYISVLDRNLRITAANRRFKEEFGEHLGGHCYEVYKHRSEACPQCPVADTFRDGQSYTYEEIITTPRGNQFNLLMTTAPIRDGQGQITQVMEMSTNITEIRKLQDHLASLGLLIGSISHGVKGLLTALDGGIYSIDSGLKRGDQKRIVQGWDVVKLMVRRIKSTVLDVLYYAKDREIELDRVEVAQFAQQVALTVDSKAKKHGVLFKADIADDLGDFHVDPNALNPALINILENAVDACLEDQTKPNHRVLFRVTREDDIIVFDVVDNGVGMDEEAKEKMFTLFFSSKGSSGTGLGLFIASDTIRQHKGTITVDSEPGEGTHFHIRIPVHRRLVAIEV